MVRKFSGEIEKGNGANSIPVAYSRKYRRRYQENDAPEKGKEGRRKRGKQGRNEMKPKLPQHYESDSLCA